MLENIGVMSKSQTIRSIKELRVCGFITLIARNKGETSKYIFSQRWFVGGNENYEIQDHYGMNK